MIRLTHPSVLASASAGTVLVLIQLVTSVPIVLWAVWVALAAVAVAQALRD